MDNIILWFTAVCSLAAACAGAALVFLQKRGRIATEDLLMELLQQELSDQSEEALRRNSEMRRELNETLRASSMNMTAAVRAIGDLQADRIERLERRSGDLNAAVDTRLERIRADVAALRTENAAQLEQIRQNVEDRLQQSIDKRLNTSFSLVQRQLEAVQSGLGEMRTLAASVGDLGRMLTGIKVRGTWGEVQLRAILEQVLSPDQFAANVAVRPDTMQRVEYAVRLPGDGERPVWLPIDSKFPLEDYHRLCDAASAGDESAAAAARSALFKTIENEAKDISTKYIVPPYSTDFALLFVPIEGLYAEVMRDPELAERLQRRWRVVAAGPSTLAALLSSLRMGFRALAIQQRGSEVWDILAAVRAEFGRFGESLERARRQLAAAANSIEDTGRRTRALRRRLDAVETLNENEEFALRGEEGERAEEGPDEL